MVNKINYNNVFLIDIETLLNLGRQLKIPSYKVWKNLCSSGSIQSENQAIDKANKTLYRYLYLNVYYIPILI